MYRQGSVQVEKVYVWGSSLVIQVWSRIPTLHANLIIAA